MKKNATLGQFYFMNSAEGYSLGAFGDFLAELPKSVRDMNEKDKLLLFEALEKVYAMGKRHGKS